MDAETRAKAAIDGLALLLEPAERPYIAALGPALLATLGDALGELERQHPQAIQHCP